MTEYTVFCKDGEKVFSDWFDVVNNVERMLKDGIFDPERDAVHSKVTLHGLTRKFVVFFRMA